MTIKLTSLISLMLIVNSVFCVEMSYEKFKSLEPCQSQCINLFKVQKANPSAESPELVACKAGCNLLVELKPTSMECSEKCKLYTSGDSSLNACVKACTNFIDLSKPAVEEPVITEIKNVEDIKEIKDIVPAIQIDPKPIEKIVEAPAKVNDNDDDDSSEKENNSSEEKEPKKSGGSGSSSSSSSEEDIDKDIESPFEVFRHFFGSSLVGGEPQVGVLPVNNQDDKKTDDLIPADLNNLEQQGNTFDSLFNYFDKFRDSLKSAYDKGSYILRVRIFSNGTVEKTYQELPSISSASSDNDQSSVLFNNIDSLLPPSDKDNLKLAGDDEVNGNRLALGGSGINWKGIPLAIGKPIIEPYQPDHEHEQDQDSMFFRYRECKPIRFHLNSLCHDINNLFTCASMRTGLPRWFFLSAILLTSFLMIWLGLFILSTLRRLRKRERVIQYSEEYLPLYKDIEFEKDGELNEAFEVTAGPLPIKQNIV